MAWDTERTKQLLLDAGTREFCDFGLAGARVDRIAERAGVNKERIYQYFGKKDAFFDVVIVRALALLMDEVPLTGEGPEAFGDYAGRLFDRHNEDRTVSRLLFWEGLERGGAALQQPERVERHALKVARLAEMLPDITEAQAADLLMTVVTLCDAWVVLPHLDALFTGTTDAAPGLARRAERRAAIVETVTLAARAAVERAARS